MKRHLINDNNVKKVLNVMILQFQTFMTDDFILYVSHFCQLLILYYTGGGEITETRPQNDTKELR